MTVEGSVGEVQAKGGEEREEEEEGKNRTSLQDFLDPEAGNNRRSSTWIAVKKYKIWCKNWPVLLANFFSFIPSSLGNRTAVTNSVAAQIPRD